MLQRLVAGVAIAAVAALALVGCTPEEPTETTPAVLTPGISTPPPLANELQRARSAWERYQSSLSDLGRDPASVTADQLVEVATAEHAAFLQQNFEAAAERRIHTEGERGTLAFELVEDASSATHLLVLICEDLSNERLVGDEGQDLTPPDQSDPRSRAVDFTRDRDRYLVADVVAYVGDAEADPCR